jgi:dephospho-CoA kinase
VVATFGPSVLDPGGGLDRKRLGELVFGDAEARKKLNAITHPLVRRSSQERFTELDRQGITLAGYDVPLLFEVGLDRALRPVVVVAASEANRVQRLAARSGLTREEAQARIAAQLPLAEKRARADHVIENDGAREELAAQVEALIERLRAGSVRA